MSIISPWFSLFTGWRTSEESLPAPQLSEEEERRVAIQGALNPHLLPPLVEIIAGYAPGDLPTETVTREMRHMILRKELIPVFSKPVREAWEHCRENLPDRRCAELVFGIMARIPNKEYFELVYSPGMIATTRKRCISGEIEKGHMMAFQLYQDTVEKWAPNNLDDPLLDEFKQIFQSIIQECDKATQTKQDKSVFSLLSGFVEKNKEIWSQLEHSFLRFQIGNELTYPIAARELFEKLLKERKVSVPDGMYKRCNREMGDFCP